MRHPWANTLLLVFIGAELVSGFFGLVSSSPDEAIFMQLHRVAGYGILGVLLWKAVNIRFSLRRPRRSVPRWASITLAVLLTVALGLGLAWSFVGPYYFWLFSGVSWHIYVGAALVPVLVWHTLHQTRRFRVGFWDDRRSFLRLAGLSVAGVVLWQTAEGGKRVADLSGAARRFTGSYEDGAPGSFPVVSWLNDRPPRIEASEWSMSIGNAVQRELVVGFDDVTAGVELETTIDCTGGWYSTQRWRGTPLAELLEEAGPLPEASSVTVTSATGYYRRFSMAEAADYLLATHVGGAALSRGHGFPVRLVAPGKRGFEWVKWVERIDVNTTPKWLQPPLPVQ